MVKLVRVNKHNPDSIKDVVKLLRGNKMVVNKEFLKSRNVPDVESIPISSEEYINETNNLIQEQIENIMFPEVISRLQQDLKFLVWQGISPPSQMYVNTRNKLDFSLQYF